MNLSLPNIFKRENHTLENFYRYGYLFFSFIFLFIALTVKFVYLPTSTALPGLILTPNILSFIFWLSLLLFADAFFASVFYKKHDLFGIWRHKNIILFFYLGVIVVLLTLFIFNYLYL